MSAAIFYRITFWIIWQTCSGLNRIQTWVVIKQKGKFGFTCICIVFTSLLGYLLNADLVACPASLYPICVQRSSEARRTLGRLTGQSTDLVGRYMEYLLDLILSNNLRVLG